jgi:hypothetical protein
MDRDRLEPEEEASEGALAAAESFLGAITSGNGDAVWEMFSDTAQAYIINLGHERGMDFDLSSRLRTDTATEAERFEFRSDLLAGLQRDLAGVDFERLAFDSKAEPEAPMQVRVTYLVQIGPEEEQMLTAIPAGAIVLFLQDEVWKVERLIPGPGRR